MSKLWSGGVASLAALVLMTGACGGNTETAKPVVANAKSSKPIVLDDTIAFAGINNLANTAQLAVIGTVTAASAPYDTTYTSRTGITVAKLVQDVHLRVDHVIFANQSEASTAVGQDLLIGIEQDGEAVTTPSGYTVKKDERSGPFAVGDQVLVLLWRLPDFPGPKGSQRIALTLVKGWQSHWTVDGGLAKSVDPGRTVPLAALLQRLQAERAAGTQPGRDPGTEEDPTNPATP